MENWFGMVAYCQHVTLSGELVWLGGMLSACVTAWRTGLVACCQHVSLSGELVWLGGMLSVCVTER